MSASDPGFKRAVGWLRASIDEIIAIAYTNGIVTKEWVDTEQKSREDVTNHEWCTVARELCAQWRKQATWISKVLDTGGVLRLSEFKPFFIPLGAEQAIRVTDSDAVYAGLYAARERALRAASEISFNYRIQYGHGDVVLRRHRQA
ncbi:MAG: hypothetical protein ACPG77_10545 [Nannocystaceae bacterium]